MLAESFDVPIRDTARALMRLWADSSSGAPPTLEQLRRVRQTGVHVEELLEEMAVGKLVRYVEPLGSPSSLLLTVEGALLGAPRSPLLRETLPAVFEGLVEGFEAEPGPAPIIDSSEIGALRDASVAEMTRVGHLLEAERIARVEWIARHPGLFEVEVTLGTAMACRSLARLTRVVAIIETSHDEPRWRPQP